MVIFSTKKTKIDKKKKKGERTVILIGPYKFNSDF
jgi:hypothetical protein